MGEIQQAVSCFSGAAEINEWPHCQEGRAACPLTILIPARDEEAVIGETLDRISAFLDPGDRCT